MKKLTYLCAVAALCAACNNGQNGYVIKGNIEGANNGDSIFLKTIEGRKVIDRDTAIIENGTFSFKGKQDSAQYCVIAYQKSTEQNPIVLDLYLQNGNINANVSADPEKNTVSGTELNDKYQVFRNAKNELNEEANKIYQSLTDTTLTEEAKKAKFHELDLLSDKMEKLVKESAEQNIDNPIGLDLIKSEFRYWDPNFTDSLLSKLPATYQNNPDVIKIKEIVDKKKLTAVGQQYTNFTLQTPEGKDISLSDFVGKNKLVLVDFWASWCGPCRKEMPNVVELYKKYHKDGLEIVGVSLDQDKEAWINAIKKLDITWPQMSDLKGWQNVAAQIYSVQGIPHTMLINQKGEIVARGLVGEQLYNKVAEELK